MREASSGISVLARVLRMEPFPGYAGRELVYTNHVDILSAVSSAPLCDRYDGRKRNHRIANA